MAFYSRINEKFLNLIKVYLAHSVILESNICTGETLRIICQDVLNGAHKLTVGKGKSSFLL